MGPAERGPDSCLLPALFEAQGPVQTDIVAHPHTAAAQNAQVIVPVVERVFLFQREVPVINRVRRLRQADLFHYILELAQGVVRAVVAARRHTDLADRSLEFGAVIFFPAEETACRMLAQEELQHLLAERPHLRGICPDHHAFLDGRRA